MKLAEEFEAAAVEGQRILEEYRRRERENAPDLYAAWRTEEIFMRTGRRRVAATMLCEAGVFPQAGDPCLEIGFGSLGWLGELVCWGVGEADLHGIELDPARVGRAKEMLPSADLRAGDAATLPWEGNSFRLVIASTVFTSILDRHVRHMVAREITRVLAPGGALLWYDFAVNNPGNPHVRKVGRRELRELFPRLQGRIKSVTLAPPLARWVVPKSWLVATLLEALPVFRTHLLAVLVKPS